MVKINSYINCFNNLKSLQINNRYQGRRIIFFTILQLVFYFYIIDY